MNHVLLKTLLLSVACGGVAFAKNSPRSGATPERKLEVYSANEAGEPTTIIQSVPGPASVPDSGQAPAKTLPKVATPVVHAPTLVTRPAAMATISSRAYTVPKGDFDPVPSEHAASIAGRLKLVEVLITRYGRAYDYRIHTQRELEAILNELEAKEDGAAAVE